MHPQRSPESADGHEDVSEIRVLAEQFRELVDDDEQHWKGCKLGTRTPRPIVSRNPVEVACQTKRFLSAVHFAGQGIAHPSDQGHLVGQVGDDGRDVRRRLEANKCRLATP
jgi:hypothetical protein